MFKPWIKVLLFKLRLVFLIQNSVFGRCLDWNFSAPITQRLVLRCIWHTPKRISKYVYVLDRLHPQRLPAGAVTVWGHWEQQQWTWLSESRLWLQTRCFLPEKEKLWCRKLAQTPQLQLSEVCISPSLSVLYILVFCCISVFLKINKIQT